YKILPVLAKEMGDIYPELVANQKFIEEVIRAEEQRFLETLEKGLEIIESELAAIKKSGKKALSGEVAFKLYDTFGFPLDLTETIAQENQVGVDLAGFERCMEEQREKARSAWKGSGDSKVGEAHQALAAEGLKTAFLGYQTLDCISKITAILKGGQRVQALKKGEEGEVYTEFSPFYAESGGQVGDQGQLIAPQALAEVKDTQKPAGDLIAHLVKVLDGGFKVGDEIHLKVSPITRGPTRLNHTATHLLHAALRQILGEHVKQAGSLVTPERLRFDFSHFQPMTREELLKVEDLVNEKIREDIEVQKREMSYDEAMGQGAMALFGEKYGDKVRVLKVENFSTELCGGTHVDRTGEIGVFKIVRESSVAAGVRRIEAITGAAVLQNFREMENTLLQLGKLAKADRYQDTVEKWTQQSEQLKKLEKEVSQLKAKLASGGGGGGSDILAQAKDIGGVKVLALRRDIDDLKSLRDFSDQVKDKLGSGVSVIGSAAEGKATLIVRVSKDLTPRFDAGKLAKELAALVGGSGGGKAEMAQAGGPKIDGLDGALQKVYELVG
ncbi:MAG TPA: alanine--tRNA ligase, partial [bacterium]|nr:alanine--tRNA ligase [bacterium]